MNGESFERFQEPPGRVRAELRHFQKYISKFSTPIRLSRTTVKEETSAPPQSNISNEVLIDQEEITPNIIIESSKDSNEMLPVLSEQPRIGQVVPNRSSI